MVYSAIEYLYRPMYRPASACTLPSGLVWEYLETPAGDFGVNRPDLPRSKHRFGIIATTRKLTATEREQFELEAV